MLDFKSIEDAVQHWNTTLQEDIIKQSHLLSSPVVLRHNYNMSCLGSTTIPIHNTNWPELQEPKKNEFLKPYPVIKRHERAPRITRQNDFYIITRYIDYTNFDFLKLYYNFVDYLAKEYERIITSIIIAHFGSGLLEKKHGGELNLENLFSIRTKLEGTDLILLCHPKLLAELHRIGLIHEKIKYHNNHIYSYFSTTGADIVTSNSLLTYSHIKNEYLSIYLGKESIYFSNPNVDIKVFNEPFADRFHFILTTDLCIHTPGIEFIPSKPCNDTTDEDLTNPKRWELKDLDDVKMIGFISQLDTSKK